MAKGAPVACRKSTNRGVTILGDTVCAQVYAEGWRWKVRAELAEGISDVSLCTHSVGQGCIGWLGSLCVDQVEDATWREWSTPLLGHLEVCRVHNDAGLPCLACWACTRAKSRASSASRVFGLPCFLSRKA